MKVYIIFYKDKENKKQEWQVYDICKTQSFAEQRLKEIKKEETHKTFIIDEWEVKG